MLQRPMTICETSPRDYSPPLFYRHIKSLLIPADVYVTAQRVRRLICEAFEAAFDKVDVLVAPTVGSPAQTIEECRQGFAIVDGRRVELQEERGTTGTLCTIPFNVTGLPAMSLCCGFSSQGLPIGMQVVGAPFDEARLFQVGHAYEQAAGWYRQRPKSRLMEPARLIKTRRSNPSPTHRLSPRQSSKGGQSRWLRRGYWPNCHRPVERLAVRPRGPRRGSA